MSDVPLAQKYSAKTFDRALSNLLERWKQGGGEPVKYDEAAVGMDKSTVSVCLKYLGEIGLLEIPKAGSYTVPDDVLNYRTKMGEVRKEAKREVADRLEDYPLYSEAKFMLGLEDFVLDELAEDVSGSAAVAASHDELRDVKRSLNVLAELGFLDVDEEGHVSVPADLDGGVGEPGTGDAADHETDEGAAPESGAEAADGGTTPGPQPAEGVSVPSAPVTGDGISLTMDLDITMDVTEMETGEVRKKLEVIHGVIRQDEE